MKHALDDLTLATLLTEARSHIGWADKQIGNEQLHRLYDLTKMGPTSANCSPARFVFARTATGRDKLKPSLSSGNLHKTLSAPVTVIVATDRKFYNKQPHLFPQAGYLFVVARALGLDTGPMSRFDKAKVEKTFFKATTWASTILINLGRGDTSKVFGFGRLPRLPFDDACVLA